MWKRGLLLLALIAACGDDDVPTDPPAAEPVAPTRALPRLATTSPPDALLALLPEGATFYAQVASLDEFEREFGWLFPVITGGTLAQLLADELGLDPDDLDRTRPIAFATRPAADDPIVNIAPVRDPDRVQAPVVRGAGSYAAWPEWAVRERGTDTSIARDLPAGTVSGRVLLQPLVQDLTPHVDGPLLQLVRLQIEGPLVETLRRGLLALQNIDFVLRRNDAALQFDAVLGTSPGGPFDSTDAQPNPLPDLLACLRRDYPLVVGANVDFRTAAGLLKPLFDWVVRVDPSVADDRSLEAWLELGRGFVVAAAVDAYGIEVAMIANARDGERFLDIYTAMLGAQFPAAGLGRIEARPDLTLDGVRVRERRLVIDLSAARDPVAGPFARQFHAFRVKKVEGEPEDQRWGRVQEDADRIRQRLRPGSDRTSYDVRADPDHIYVGTGLLSVVRRDDAQDEAIRAAFAVGGPVQIRVAVPPRHPTYRAYRDVLDRTLAKKKQRAGAYRIPPANRARADVEAGRFGAGLCWYRIAESARRRVHPQWQHEGYLLVALDEHNVGGDDFAWAYPSEARMGREAQYCDVHFRIKEDSLARVRDLTTPDGPLVPVVIVDHEVLAGMQPREEALGALGEIVDVTRAEAQRLANAVRWEPLHYEYEPAGERSESAVRRWERQQQIRSVVGEEGLAFRMAVVDGKVVVLVANPVEPMRDLIACVRKARSRQPAPRLARTLEYAPDADFLLHADLNAVIRGLGALAGKLVGQPAPSGFWPDLPASMEPAMVAGWHAGPRFHVRARLDKKFMDQLDRQWREERLDTARFRVKSIHTDISLWQRAHKTTNLPVEEFQESLPLDPWGRPHRIDLGEDGVFRVRGAGPDGRMDTEDDLVYPQQR